MVRAMVCSTFALVGHDEVTQIESDNLPTQEVSEQLVILPEDGRYHPKLPPAFGLGVPENGNGEELLGQMEVVPFVFLEPEPRLDWMFDFAR